VSEPDPLPARALDELARLGVAGGLVVAVSGGADSVALLRAVRAGRTKTGLARPLIVAHFNHGLRGPESDADARFVEQLTDRLRKPGAAEPRFVGTREDVAAAARRDRDNLESTARRLRYAWLAEVAKEEGCPWVATGHTADDQAETVLQRLIRGTGPTGLRGIRARRALTPEVEVIRPLLGVRRAELRAYLAEIGQPFREDASNDDPGFSRNRIRQELLPLLETYNPAVTEALNRLAAQAADLAAERDEQAWRLLQAAEMPRAGALVVIDRAPLGPAPAGLVAEVFRLVWRREGWPERDMGYEDWRRVTAVVRGEERAVDLPGGLRVSRRGAVVRAGPGL
jgi:tRNA(Ile)-lysidine synthase